MAEVPRKGGGRPLPFPLIHRPHESEQAILAGLVYRLKRGCASPYTRNSRRYCFAVPAEDFQTETIIGDCWITDEKGNPDPGLACSPVPVCRDAIGQVAGRVAYE